MKIIVCTKINKTIYAYRSLYTIRDNGGQKNWTLSLFLHFSLDAFAAHSYYVASPLDVVRFVLNLLYSNKTNCRVNQHMSHVVAMITVWWHCPWSLYIPGQLSCVTKRGPKVTLCTACDRSCVLPPFLSMQGRRLGYPNITSGE